METVQDGGGNQRMAAGVEDELLAQAAEGIMMCPTLTASAARGANTKELIAEAVKLRKSIGREDS